MRLSIVLPIFNEDKIVKETIQRIFQESKRFFEDIELIAVDDGSFDNTSIVLKELQKKDKRIKIITHKKNRGYGAAFKSGTRYATSEWIFFTDSDMQFNFSEISQLIPYTKKFDFIVGYRKNRADSARRRFISFMYNKLVKILFGLPLKDVDCAFKLMKRTSLSKILLTSNSFFISVELMTKARLKFSIKELGVTHFPRRKGKSTVTIRSILLTLRDLILLRISYL